MSAVKEQHIHPLSPTVSDHVTPQKKGLQPTPVREHKCYWVGLLWPIFLSLFLCQLHLTLNYSIIATAIHLYSVKCCLKTDMQCKLIDEIKLNFLFLMSLKTCDWQLFWCLFVEMSSFFIWDISKNSIILLLWDNASCCHERLITWAMHSVK